MHNEENEDEAPTTRHVARLKKVVHVVAHKTHSVSEIMHLGYFATGAGLLHEFHSFFAAGCGIGLLLVIVCGLNAVGDA